MHDIRRRIAMARQRFGKMRHLWQDGNLHKNLRLRLYKSCVCSILTWGSEAWKLNDEASKAINGTNSQMLSVITGKTQHQEASTAQCTFDLVKWIRARRLQWLGHILRMGPDRKAKQAVFEMFKSPSKGDLLMDAPTAESWRTLMKRAQDKEGWRERVRVMTQAPVIRVVIEMSASAEGTRISERKDKVKTKQKQKL